MQCLAKCTAEVEAALDLPSGSLELSMGMSGDFEQAVLFPLSVTLEDPFSSLLLFKE